MVPSGERRASRRMKASLLLWVAARKRVSFLRAATAVSSSSRDRESRNGRSSGSKTAARIARMDPKSGERPVRVGCSQRISAADSRQHRPAMVVQTVRAVNGQRKGVSRPAAARKEARVDAMAMQLRPMKASSRWCRVNSRSAGGLRKDALLRPRSRGESGREQDGQEQRQRQNKGRHGVTHLHVAH